jgi:endonuclease YncB( thermonuclease family)
MPKGETAGVARVIDGDTIELQGGQRLRYIGLDTPETVALVPSDDCPNLLSYILF